MKKDGEAARTQGEHGPEKLLFNQDYWLLQHQTLALGFLFWVPDGAYKPLLQLPGVLAANDQSWTLSGELLSISVSEGFCVSLKRLIVND